MPCKLHTLTNGFGHTQNASGNYSTYAPVCTCPPPPKDGVKK